ncbi:formate--tetrahydrofolate ligase [candidate division WOR-1 bacterium RIFOXYA12_FULL_52_29]|uniref:Formate--tetrahydrofolate ligase n=1 Tax=candidate division WOR-1 bacterium RIFOXYC12_FULL_54_18 TaxID=1802584 RepID=A0A1F4T5A1_UNCSA|nr:MAG: formate--tetrahydrofolate ligase [candidate division WOR-1 bacterium RIFOXYA2_FULL_51_19]OGC17303.1 MAG: formate--tetrahydrofolate ligase [candidate division WOR-1 bacterium RIFOXYA12_FULL_52_29]OGC26163.1 MAG: formate--tetrahydrofolate ligase [candidate division WOR-1 bacterium RIFOXYB2_FULL_45_9]OGC27720.1 MAG: formate--tetrahydrofolate ligase [candidate division WOR-1 bacterium RIFOXYC12_FULL_54_18]OGC29989.1 MAG: formate--tetrahydrofolate ligase [candidate division WOR-1 bacterium R
MQTDIEIAQQAKLKTINEIAGGAGINRNDIELHGCFKAKINLDALKKRKKNRSGKLILVTAMTPTPKGEGKTTTTIGLAQALRKIGKKSIVCVREPSLGPVMGMKGGAAGGGFSQVLPMEDINLHLTSDIHMVTSAHNLLAAMLYNHIFQGNELQIDEQRIVWRRVMDMNDRSLRGQFDITASSEVMAILCLSTSVTDLKDRLGRIIVAYDKSGKPVRSADLKAQGAMALLLWDALKPTLVQTIEGTPAFIHGGPFANIAHGCSSLVATQLALKLADYVVTEAGFASDLGAEKFFDIKCRVGNLAPAAAVLVVTKQAIERHGYENVAKHVENLHQFNVPVVIAINKKEDDTQDELVKIIEECGRLHVPAVVSDVWALGGEGGKELAKMVIKAIDKKISYKPLYRLEQPVKEKIEKIAREIYGAAGVDWTDRALSDLEFVKQLGMDHFPVCIAKTQYSLSDNPKLFGAPKDFMITIKELKPSAGAGFIVVFAGDIMTMPGLPKHPAAENMDIDEEGKIVGLF